MKLKYYLRGLGIGVLVTALLMGAAGGMRKPMSDEEVKERAAQLGMVDSIVLTQLREDVDAAEADKRPETGEPEETGAASESGTAETGDAAGGRPGDKEISENGSHEPAGEPLEENDGSSAAPDADDSKAPDADSSKAPDTSASKAPDPGSGEDVQSGGTKGGQADAGGSASSGSGTTPSVESTKENNQASPEDSGEDKTMTITVKRGDSSVTVSRALAAAGLVADADTYDKYLCANGYDKRISVGVYEIAAGSSDEEIAKIITKRK